MNLFGWMTPHFLLEISTPFCGIKFLIEKCILEFKITYSEKAQQNSFNI